MKATERRKELAAILSASETPVSGSALAAKLGVSRQIIVQDITVLKAAGYEILPTHSGYLMQKSPLAERVFKVYHTKEQTADELNSIVALGGTVVDVFVWHKVYGRIEAKLNISSQFHIDRFLDGVRSGKSTELMDITGGYHYHTVRAESEACLDRIGETLAAKGYIAPII
ncbi:MAG: transcription repressor NadR [Clostridia bacterium]|nr:transcription repressor NadR [Clostridia bacterium]